jgi:hypothetical protein
MVQIFLEEFAKQRCREDKMILMAMDRVPAHRAKKIEIPKGMEIIKLQHIDQS